MKLKLKNVGPFRKETTFNLDGNVVIEGDNGLGKTTIIDSIGVAFYGPYKDKKDTKRLFTLNSTTEPSYIELSDFEFCNKKYGKVTREIYRKGGARFDQKLIIDGKEVETDFFEKQLSLDRYLLMTSYSYFSKQTGDNKIISLNSFFDIDSSTILNAIVKEGAEDITKELKETMIKSGVSNNVNLTDKEVKTLFAGALHIFGLDKKDIPLLKLDIIKELSLSAGKELKSLDKRLDETFKTISLIPKASLTVETKEELSEKISSLKSEKLKYLQDINLINTFDVINSSFNLSKKIPDGFQIDWNNKGLVLNNVGINQNLLNYVKQYGDVKSSLISNIDGLFTKLNKTLDPEWQDFLNKEKIEELTEIKDSKKYKALISELKNIIEEKNNLISNGLSKEKLNDSLLVSLYNGEIDFIKNNEKLSSKDNLIILDFIKSKFITDDEVSKLNKWKKICVVLNELVNKIEYTYNNMLSIYSNKLSILNNNEFNLIVSNYDKLVNCLNLVSELKSEYIKAINSEPVKNSGSPEKFIEENNKRLSFSSIDAIMKKIEVLDKQDFDYVTKLKNLTINENHTNNFIRLTQEYKNMLLTKQSVIVFEYLMSSFAKKVLEDNFGVLNDIIEQSSNYKITMNNNNKNTIELMYRKDDGLLVPHDSMSEGIKILSDNLLMTAIYKLQRDKGSGLDFIVIDEISAISPNNRKTLIGGLVNIPGQKLITITSDSSDIKISNMEEYFGICETINLNELTNTSEYINTNNHVDIEGISISEGSSIKSKNKTKTKKLSTLKN